MTNNTIKSFFLIVITTMFILLMGCVKKEVAIIIDKMAKGESLTQEELASYGKDKDFYDELIAKRKREIEETTYKEATEAEKFAGKRMYMGRNGKAKEFDISPKACEPFGFFAGQKVEGPKGKANVVGVYDGHIWFHTDGAKGAGFSDCKNKEECASKGFKQINESAPSQHKETQTVGTTTPIATTRSDDDVYFSPIPRIPYIRKGQ